jgi:hypothetical protein
MHTCKSVGWKWAPSTFKWKLFWKLEFQSVLNLWDKTIDKKLSPQYIIVKVLKCKYQKWICTLQYFEFWIESYDQKKGHELNSQFDSWPLKPTNMDQMTFDQDVQCDIGKSLSKITTL